ncbi:MAG: biotin--[acetyl-CoA-carboxylase] ligase [Saprospiraceae bacterium]
MIFNKNTLFIGKVIHHFEQLPSTNTYAIDLLAKNKPSEGTVISTSHQVDGKGQHDSIWETSANQNITLSVILYPTFLLPKHQFWLSQAVALAVRDFVAEILPQKKVCIKWSNDIYVNDKKIAGILIQNSINRNGIANSVIGIGLNVLQADFNFKGQRRATSLFLEKQESYNLDYLKYQLYWHLESRYLQLKANKIHQIQSDYMDVLYKYKIPHQYELPNGEQFTGTIQGIEPNGQLVINRNDELLSFGIKEVKFL